MYMHCARFAKYTAGVGLLILMVMTWLCDVVCVYVCACVCVCIRACIICILICTYTHTVEYREKSPPPSTALTGT